MTSTYDPNNGVTVNGRSPHPFDQLHDLPTPIRLLPPVEIPSRHIRTSYFGMGPIPFGKINATRSLVDEANLPHHSHPRRPDVLTPAEESVRTGVEKQAQAYLDRAVTHTIEPKIRRVKNIHAEINNLDHQISSLPNRSYIGPDGQTLTPEQADEYSHLLAHEVASDNSAGATVHQGVNGLSDTLRGHKATKNDRRREFAKLAMDAPVFFLAMLGLLNVNYQLILIDAFTTIMAGVALVFALLGTILLAVTMRDMARRHRRYKNKEGGITAPPTVARRMKIELIALITIGALAVGVMSSRVLVDGLNADSNPILVGTLALLFGGLIGYSAYTNYTSVFDNSSIQIERLEYLTGQFQHREDKLDSAKNARSVLIESAGQKAADIHRAIAKARTDAEHTVSNSNADKALRIARSYHGRTGISAALPPVRLDYSRLDLAATQATNIQNTQNNLERHI